MKLLKWLNWTLVIPLLVLILLLVILLYSNAGLRFSVWTAERFLPQLTVEDSHGTLLGGMQLDHIRWQQDGIDTNLKQLIIDINNRCLLQARICVRQLAVNGLDLSIKTAPAAESAENNEPSPPSSGSPLWLPIPVNIDRIVLNDIRLQFDDTSLSWQQFSTGLTAWGNKVQLEQPDWRHIRLKLPPGAPAAEPQPFQYQPPVLPELALPLSLFVNQFQLTDFVLEQEVPQTLEKLTFSLQLQQQQAKLIDLQLQHEMATATASLDITTSGNYPLKGHLGLNVTQTELAGQQLTLQLNGDLSRLIVQARATNLLHAELDAELHLLTEDLPLQLSLNASTLRWPLNDTPLITVTGTTLTLNGDLNNLVFNGHTQYQGPDIPAGTLNMQGQLTPQTVNLERFNLKTLGGQLELTAQADWQSLVQWQTTVSLQDIQPGLFWPDYQGHISGTLQHNGQLTGQGGWQIALEQLNLHGMIRDFPLQLAGSFSASDPAATGEYQFHTEQLQLKHGENLLSLQGELADQWQLNMQLVIPDLGDSLADAGGKIDGSVVVSGMRNAPQLDASLNASSLRWQDIALASLTARADITVAEIIQADITLQARNGQYQQQKLEQLDLRLQGTEQQHRLTLSLNAPLLSSSVALSGQLVRDKHWQGQLNQASVTSVQGAWSLTSPAALNYQFPQQLLTVQQHCWQQQQSRLCLNNDVSLSAEQGQAELVLQQFELNSLNVFLTDTTKLSGTVDASVSASWSAGLPPAAEITLTGSPGSLQQQLELPLTLPWQQFSLQASLQQNNLNSQLQIHFTDTATLAATADINNIQDDNRQLQATLQLEQFTLHFLQPLLDEYSELEGILSSNLTASGDLLSPQLYGQLALNKLKIKGKLAPVDINQADIALNFNGQQADLSGDIKTPEGELKLSGQADWQDLAKWHSELHLQGDELRLQIPQARFRVKPDLHITARPDLTRLTGTIEIPGADINIDSLPQNAVALSDDIILLDSNLQPVTESTQDKLTIETDLKVILGNRVRLSAFGLKSSLRGELRVVQQHNQPSITGEVQLIDGTFRSYGQDLLIRTGKMNFNGPADQPFLNVEAIRNPANMEDDVIAGIRVTGPADEPLVTIFSEPAKPQANALSYLLMGRDLDSESGSAVNAVTTGLIGMGIASSSKLVGEIGEAFGVRDLTLDTAGAGDNSQVTVSGYLSRDLQVKYGVGIFNSIGEFTLRYRLMRSLYLEAVSGLDNAVDLLYKFEFD